MDLDTYVLRGDKKNSGFFEEYLPRIYRRRAETGVDELVGDMAAVVIQVEHGDAVDYLAELALLGPYRLVDSRLGDTHRGLLGSVGRGIRCSCCDRNRSSRGSSCSSR